MQVPYPSASWVGKMLDYNWFFLIKKIRFVHSVYVTVTRHAACRARGVLCLFIFSCKPERFHSCCSTVMIWHDQQNTYISIPGERPTNAIYGGNFIFWSWFGFLSINGMIKPINYCTIIGIKGYWTSAFSQGLLNINAHTNTPAQ